MPSKSEPCGLAQMVALRYGTIPIVRETGGLKDTVTDSGDNEGNGFTFKSYNAHDMARAVERAVDFSYYFEKFFHCVYPFLRRVLKTIKGKIYHVDRLPSSNSTGSAPVLRVAENLSFCLRDLAPGSLAPSALPVKEVSPECRPSAVPVMVLQISTGNIRLLTT